VQFRSVRGIALLFWLAISIPACHLGEGVVHRVEQNDEPLLQIAHVYDVEVEEILQANPSLDPFHLRLGQRIFIPGASQRVSARAVPDQVDRITEEEGPPPSESPQESLPAGKRKPETRPPAPKAGTAIALSKPKSTTKSVSIQTPSRFIWPASGVMISSFGKRRQKMHNGIDIKVPPGSEIRASADGQVVYRGRGVAGYGDLLILRHGRLFTVYAYLGQILADVGDVVKAGKPLARALSGNAGAFIHFEIRQGKTALDPLRFLPR
jgi:lipoprotein NlpD